MLFGTPKNPKGPVGRWDHAEVGLSGTVLRFSIPQTNLIVAHDHLDPVKEQTLYDHQEYYIDKDYKYLRRPPKSSLCRREWQFDGLRWGGGLGGYGVLALDIRLDQFADFASLFRPRRRECAIERFIYSSLLFHKTPDSSCKYYRLDYGMSNQVWSCYMDVDSLYVCQTPISDEHMLSFVFNPNVYQPKTQVVKAMMALAHKIMGTVKVELSEDAKRMKHEAQTQYPWESLQQTLPSYDFEHMEKTHYDDFLRAASVQLNHNSDLPYERFEAIANKMQAQEMAELTAIRKRVLASHMRFTELEAQDAKVHRKSESV